MDRGRLVMGSQQDDRRMSGFKTLMRSTNEPTRA
jgi:hypothetical protein